jgi:hypothetical protein
MLSITIAISLNNLRQRKPREGRSRNGKRYIIAQSSRTSDAGSRSVIPDLQSITWLSGVVFSGSAGGSVECRSHMQQSDAMSRVDRNMLNQVSGCESYSVIGPVTFNARWVGSCLRSFPIILNCASVTWNHFFSVTDFDVVGRGRRSDNGRGF